MLIQSLIQRPNGTEIKLGDDVYLFSPNITDGLHMCEVVNSEHIETLLAITEGFSEVVVKLETPKAKAGK